MSVLRKLWRSYYCFAQGQHAPSLGLGQCMGSTSDRHLIWVHRVGCRVCGTALGTTTVFEA